MHWQKVFFPRQEEIFSLLYKVNILLVRGAQLNLKVAQSPAECCVLAPFVAPSITPSSTAERPRLAEGQALTHSHQVLVV